MSVCVCVCASGGGGGGVPKDSLTAAVDIGQWKGSKTAQSLIN